METYTQPSDIIEQFRKRKHRQWFLSGLLAVGALLLWWLSATVDKGALQRSQTLVVVLFAALAVGAVIFSFFNWRCPACDRYLGRTRSPHFCPKCGAKFVEEV